MTSSTAGWSYGLILSKEVLNIFSERCINLHTSLLPKWRGAAPIQRCILNGDRETGVSIMKMEEKLDSGEVYLQKKFYFKVLVYLKIKMKLKKKWSTTQYVNEK